MFRRLIYSHRPTARRVLFILVLLLFPAFVFISLHQASSGNPPSFILDHPYFRYDFDALEPRYDKDQRCILPRVHPFDPSIWGFLSPPREIVCVTRRPELTFVAEDGWLKFNKSELLASGYNLDKSLTCHWSKVERGGASDSGNIDDVISYGKESPLPEGGSPLPPDVEILRVVCRNFAGFAVYDRLHARIRDARTATTGKSDRATTNVLIFGLDSMSRLSFVRHLPLTYRYLTEELGMTVLRGMNKVGDNSYPNLVALLTGKAAYGGDLPDSRSGFDDWPIIWGNYSRAGYVTLWAEDFPEFGLFNYLAEGFRQPPTHHYLRPFWLAVKESPLLKISSHLCYGKVPRYQLQMAYLRQFIAKYGAAGVPFFGFSFLAELSHDYVSRISAADAHFRDFFRWLAESGRLDDTLLLVMSDHGHRFNVIRSTRVGHIEERMPFHAVRIPPGLASRQPQALANLRSNAGRLTTPFDVYATLADLLSHIQSGSGLGLSPAPSGILGTSLFSPISGERTCRNASVPGHFCACETAAEIDVRDARVRIAARATVDHVNRLLKEHGDNTCSALTVGRVATAQLVRTMEEEEKETKGRVDGDQRIRVVVEAQPSLALLEATVILRGQVAEVWGEVSRINAYAGQDSCIRHVILRKYCFCVSDSKRDVSKL